MGLKNPEQLLIFPASSLTPPRSESGTIGSSKHAKESESEDSDDDMGNDDDDDDEEEEEIALDLEEVEAVSKKARQDEEILTEHAMVLEKLKANQRKDYLKVCLIITFSKCLFECISL